MRQKQNVDIIIGIPSYNEADSIGFVVKQVDLGLKKYFPKLNGLIINVDNNSPDGTKHSFVNIKSKTQKLYISTPVGVKGKGRNFYNLFKQVEKYQPKAVVVVDADLRSIRPDWIKKFVEPVLSGYDFCLPLYSRSKYDATITNQICYPIVYGLLKRDLRQPIGGDFSFSSRIVSYWLKQEWHKTTREFGIDNFMTLGAIFGNFKIGQVYLGSKIHKPSAPKLNEMFLQVADTFIKTILLNQKKWINIKSPVKKAKIFGGTKWQEPQKLTCDVKTLEINFINEYKKQSKDIKKYLSNQSYQKVLKMAENNLVTIDSNLWNQIVCDLIIAYKKNNYSLKIIKTLRTLYFGRVASFVKEVNDSSEKQSENKIKKQAELFSLRRRYLIEKLK